MPNKILEIEDFLRDVSAHQMQILRDDELYRHIRFKRPSTSTYFFDVITWPGHLCYTGDMGTYVFSRIDDMLEFFRSDRQPGGSLRIRPHYWSEKLLAVDGGRGPGCALEYDHAEFLAVIEEYLSDWLEDLDDEYQAELREDVQENVLQWLEEDDEHGNFTRAYDFSTTINGRKYQFTDLFERSFRRFTHHFLWCCYALSWGIQKYDEHKSPSDQERAA